MSVDGGMDQDCRSRNDEMWADSGFILMVKTIALTMWWGLEGVCPGHL